MSQRPPANPGTALGHSICSQDLTDSLTTIVDAGLDATATVLHGVPVLGVLVGIARAGSSINKELEFRKVVNFLISVGDASEEKRNQFVNGLKQSGKIEEFGQNILLLLSRLDDMRKPTIIGRIVAAHINGDIDYEKAMRLAAMVDRCYAVDLEYLRSFKPGPQREGADIAAMLFSAGLLANNGIDGGSLADPQSGGIIYDLNAYGELLLKYAL